MVILIEECQEESKKDRESAFVISIYQMIAIILHKCPKQCIFVILEYPESLQRSFEIGFVKDNYNYHL